MKKNLHALLKYQQSYSLAYFLWTTYSVFSLGHGHVVLYCFTLWTVVSAGYPALLFQLTV